MTSPKVVLYTMAVSLLPHEWYRNFQPGTVQDKNVLQFSCPRKHFHTGPIVRRGLPPCLNPPLYSRTDCSKIIVLFPIKSRKIPVRNLRYVPALQTRVTYSRNWLWRRAYRRNRRRWDRREMARSCSPYISPVINLRLKNGRVCCCMQISRPGRQRTLLCISPPRADWVVIYGAPSVNRVMHGDRQFQKSDFSLGKKRRATWRVASSISSRAFENQKDASAAEMSE